MKKLFALLLLVVFSNTALADCDWSGIVANNNGTFTYSKELHLCVGQMKQDLDSAHAQIADYKKIIELKDLALDFSNKRADMWMDTSLKLENRLNAIDSLRSKNETLYFGLGVAMTALAVWGAGQLR